MGFNLKSFLRRASPEVLREYIDGRQITLNGPIDWNNLEHTRPEALFSPSFLSAGGARA